ncbi:MAG: cyclase [Chloroflexota bacterium]|nr:cyclase family protein [Caldilinea sp.]GIK74248.1 MAG: cyclase [Chloroflexota bacterium]
MCVPACTKKIASDLGRRTFLRSAAGLAAATALAGCAPITARSGIPQAIASTANTTHSFSRIFDLTHTLAPNFPTFGGDPQLELETLVTLANDGYNMLRWLLVEHTGTHMDAPYHFSDGLSADQIAVEDLMGPLAVVDIRAKAEENPDAQLTPDDLTAWESEHGPIPDGAIVAMNSGWDAHVATDKFRNVDDSGVMHFPGFHIEAIEMLLQERNVKGIFVDTLSLDFGPSPDFAVHYRWLPANKWGIENVANLGALPPSGAIAIVGGPTIAGATGGPSRIFALV